MLNSVKSEPIRNHLIGITVTQKREKHSPWHRTWNHWKSGKDRACVAPQSLQCFSRSRTPRAPAEVAGMCHHPSGGHQCLIEVAAVRGTKAIQQRGHQCAAKASGPEDIIWPLSGLDHEHNRNISRTSRYDYLGGEKRTLQQTGTKDTQHRLLLLTSPRI